MKKCIGIDIIAKDNQVMYRFAIIRNDKRELVITDLSESTSEEAVCTFAKQHTASPIIVNIIGFPNVMEKLFIQKQPELSDILGVKVDQPEMFCMQNVRDNASNSWAAIIRKDKLMQLLEPLRPIFQQIISISLTEAIYGTVLKATQKESAQPKLRLAIFDKFYDFQHGNYALLKEDETFEKITEIQLAQSLNVSPQEVAMMAHFLHILWAGPFPLLPEIKDSFEGFQQWEIQRKYIVRAAAVTVPIMFMLLGWVFYYRTQIADMKVRYEANAAIYNEIQSNRLKINEKESLLKEKYGGARQNANHVAWLMDKFAAQLPESMYFTKVLYHPDTLLCKKWEILPTQIPDFIVQGIATHSGQVTMYIQRIEEMEQIHKVEMLQSEFDFEKEEYTYDLAIFLHSQ